MASLTNYLHNKRMLLLLDNCEHLIDSCAQLAEPLLQACPGLQILATSREALDIEGERILQVNPLALPGPEHPPTSEGLLDCDSIQLFVERAEAARPAFAIMDDNASAVVRICLQLDGLPLAIELAAKQLKALPVEQIASRLEDRFLLLTNGHRTALPHHHTLRAALDWSYDYLSEEEQSFFRQLSTFAGGWTLEAAEHVAAANALELLTALTNKSLVIVEQSAHAVRYSMLETLRRYGQEKLINSGQQAQVRSRHLEYYLQFAECSRMALRGGDQRFRVQPVELELDNIRAALDWSLHCAKESEAGLRLAIAMSEFWNRRSYFREERQWLECTLAATGETSAARLRAWANARLAYCAFCLGDFESLGLFLDRAWSVFCDLEDVEGMAFVLQGRATLAGEQKHDLATARACLAESFRLLELTGDKWNMAEALKGLGRISYLQGDLDKAKTFLDTAARLCREVSNRWQLGMILVQLGFVALQEANYHVARSFFEESRQLANEFGDRDTSIDTLSGLGELARCEGNYQQARTYYEEGLAAVRELGTQQGAAYLQRGLGHVMLHVGGHEQASVYFNQALQYWQEQDMRHPIAGCLAGLAGVATARGDMQCAAQLLGKVGALITETSPFRSPADQTEYEQSISLVRAHLGEKQYWDYSSRGAAMSLEQVSQSAFSNLEDRR